MPRSRLAVLLSFNAGYVDTMGFLALAGLFTAHVTGNFVTLGAALALGGNGAIAKMLALPVFCVAVLVARQVEMRLPWQPGHKISLMLFVMLALFSVTAIVARVHGAFTDANDLVAISTGMTLVTAMAIQNTLHRVHLPALPPSTLMTGTTTQVMLDIADLISGKPIEKRDELIARLRRMITSLLSFAAGCAAGAFAYIFSGTWCFAVPPLLIVLSLIIEIRENGSAAETSKEPRRA